ncbi:MAG: hypothetical protein ACYDDB_01240 [bacterium]
MIKIILSFLLIAVSVLLFAFWTNPLVKSVNLLKTQKGLEVMRKHKIESQINIITAVTPQKTALGFHKMSSYMFTLLSYMDYLNSRGLNVKINLASGKNKNTVAGGVSAYEENTGFTGIKKVDGVISFTEVLNLNAFLKVITGVYKAFPIKLTEISLVKQKNKLNGKIYFELFSIGGSNEQG